MPQSFDSNPEFLSQSLTRHYLHEGRIVVYTLLDIHQTTLDLWAEQVRHDFDTWPHELYLSLHDFSQISTATLSPYLRRKSEELTSMDATKGGRSAIVISVPAFLAQMLELFLTSMHRQHHAARERRMFNNGEDALKWIEEMIEARPA